MLIKYTYVPSHTQAQTHTRLCSSKSMWVESEPTEKQRLIKGLLNECEGQLFSNSDSKSSLLLLGRSGGPK